MSDFAYLAGVADRNGWRLRTRRDCGFSFSALAEKPGISEPPVFPAGWFWRAGAPVAIAIPRAGPHVIFPGLKGHSSGDFLVYARPETRVRP